MLNIKKKGLLYKWLDKSSPSFSNKLKANRVTLCYLFWKCVQLLLTQLGLAAVVVLMSLGMGGIIAQFFGIAFAAGVTPWYILIGLAISGALLISTILIVIFGIGVGITIGLERITRWRDSSEFTRELKERKARDEELHFGNIYQKMKIFKKDKLCPMIRVDYGE